MSLKTFVFSLFFSVNLVAAESSVLLDVFVSDGSGDCLFKLNTQNQRELKGFTFTCENDTPKTYTLVQAQGNSGVILKSKNLIFFSCTAASLKIKDVDPMNHVTATMFYTTNCLTGAKSSISFDALWNGNKWIAKKGNQEAHCLNINIGGAGISSVDVVSDPNCAQ